MKSFHRFISHVLIVLVLISTLTPSVLTPRTLAAAKGDLVVTAFMADPTAVSDDVGEWLQLTNTTAEAIDLNGWLLTDDDRQTYRFHKETKDAAGAVTVLPISVAAVSTITLCRNDDVKLNGGVMCDYSYGKDFQLKNAGGAMVLLDNGLNRREVDRIEYAGYWIVPGNVSRLKDIRLDNGTYQNWMTEPFVPVVVAEEPVLAPQQPGTPTTLVEPEEGITKQVSPYPQTALAGDIIVSEFFADPTDVSDDQGEWLELYNTTNQTLNLDLWSLSDNDGQSHMIDVADGLFPIESGSYVTLCRNGDYLKNGGVACNYAYGTGFQLKNDGDAIILSDIKGKTISHVTYPNYWVTPGASTSLKDVRLSDASYLNWDRETTVAIDSKGRDTGTPGRRNGALATTVEATPVDITPISISQIKVDLPTGVTVLGKTGIQVGKTNENFGDSMAISAAVEPTLERFIDSGQPLQVMAWNSTTRQWEGVGTEKNITDGQLSVRLSHATFLIFVSNDPLASYLLDSLADDGQPAEEVPSQPVVEVAQPEITVTERTERIFTDLAPTFWAYDYIKALKDAGVINGYPDQTYRPYRYTNRAEMAKIALKAFGQKPNMGMNAHFKDVPADAWFAPFVGKAQALGVIQIKNGYFNPERVVTRAEALALLLRASRLKMDLSTKDSLKTDVETSDWFSGYVVFAEERGFIDDGNRFSANKPANRATVAMMAARILEYAQNADDSSFFATYDEMKAATMGLSTLGLPS